MLSKSFFSSLAVLVLASYGQAQDPASRPVVLYAPQLAVGAANGVEITTIQNFRVASVTEGATIKYSYLNADGSSGGVMSTFPEDGLVVDTGSGISSLSPASYESDILSVHPDLGPGLHTGSIRFETTETWSEETGTWELDVQIGVGYVIRDLATRQVLAAVATEVSRGRTRHLLNLWEVVGPPSIKIGLSILNPNDEPVEVTVRAIVDRSDPDRLSTTFPLGPREQLPRYVSELFEADPQAAPAWESVMQERGGRLFTTLEIDATLPVAVTALRSDDLLISGWDVGPGRVR